MRTDHDVTNLVGGARGATGDEAFVFSRRVRLVTSVGAPVLVVAAAGLSSLAGADRDGYVLAHSLAGAPFTVGALVLARITARHCPPCYRRFWQLWFAANVCGALATVAAIGSVAFRAPALLVVDMLLLLAAVPFWAVAGTYMVRAQAGRRDSTVDSIDATMAVLVLGTPGVLLLAEPVLASADLAFAGPFALLVLLVPAGVYGVLVNLARMPRSERVGHVLGLAVAASFAVSVTLQLAHVLGDLVLPLPVFVGFHALNLATVMALPLWSHRISSGGLARLPVAQQVRSHNPMPVIGAVVLPLAVLYVLVFRAHDRWATTYLAAVMLTVIVLNALRHSRLSREAGRLSSELAAMAEERRQLLASMVRALDDDRRRTVSELHTQAVGSLSTLGTVVQTACMSLPAPTAEIVRRTIAELQGDLSARAEELRMLMLAMRPPAFAGDGAHAGDGGGAGDDALSAALRAYASELRDETSVEPPGVQVVVDPQLELDRSTMTIVYRIAQEALLNVFRHASATHVAVTVSADDETRGVVVEVADDGVGFETGQAREGSGLSSMRLFADLGRGDLTVRTSPGAGTVVRCQLGVRLPGAATDRHVDRGRGDAVDRAAVVGAAGGHPALAEPPPGEPEVDDTPAARRGARRHLRVLPPLDAAPHPT